MSEIGLDPQRFVIVLDGAVVFADIVEGVAAVFVAVGIVRLEPDGLVQRFKRGLDLAALAEDFAAGAEGAGTIGIPGDDGGDFGQRLVGLAAAVQRGSAGNHGIETGGIRRCRIIDQRRAALAQQRGGGICQRCANDGLGGRLGAGSVGAQDSNGKHRACGKRRNE